MRDRSWYPGYAGRNRNRLLQDRIRRLEKWHRRFNQVLEDTGDYEHALQAAGSEHVYMNHLLTQHYLGHIVAMLDKREVLQDHLAAHVRYLEVPWT